MINCQLNTKKGCKGNLILTMATEYLVFIVNHSLLTRLSWKDVCVCKLLKNT